MALTQQDVAAWLRPEEPDYHAAAAALGVEAVPVLAAMASDPDERLAARAVSLAGAIGGEAIIAVLIPASSHPSTLVRTQAAAAVRTVPPQPAASLLVALLRDPDTSVRKFSLLAAINAGTALPREAWAEVQRMRTDDPQPFLRERAASAVPPP